MTAVVNHEDSLALDEHGRKLLFTEARTANTFTEEPVTEEQLRAAASRHARTCWMRRCGMTCANSWPIRRACRCRA